MALTGNNNEEKVWNFLKAKGLSDYACAGFLGNFYAESGVNFCMAELLLLRRLKERGRNYTHESYCAAVDSGAISRAEFLNPLPNCQFGFGIYQITSPARKSGFYDLCKQRGVSIADPETQLDYLWIELNSTHKNVLNAVKTANSVKEASDIVLTKFEIPADASAISEVRASYSQNYYNKYAKKSAAAPTSSTVSIGTYQVSGNMISNSGSDERGSYHSGTAGDQTGKEWQIRTWYNRPWNCVIRHPNETVRRKLSELSILAAKNDRIGYDQYERNTYWNQLQKVNYDPSKITVNCEADCSAGVIANTKAVGYLMGLSALKNITATYTGNMRDSYRNAGFTILTDNKYLTSPDYLLPGDILLNDVHHVCVCVSTGSKSGGYVAPSVTPSSSTTSSILKIGSSGSAVKTMQTMLIKLGYSCGSSGADGEFGANTDMALKKFQKDNSLEVDGEYGPASKAKLENLYSKATSKPSTVEAAMHKDAALAGTYRVTASSLNVRLTNDTSSNNNIVEVLHTEEKVTCYGYYNIKEGVKWLLVVTPTGKTGYVCATYVKK